MMGGEQNSLEGIRNDLNKIKIIHVEWERSAKFTK